MKLQALAWQTNRHSFDEKQKTASPHALKKYENLESDLNSYKETNDTRVSDLEERVNKIDEELKSFKK